MKPGARYYQGGARVVIAGVPIRLARKPSAHNLANMRKFEHERTKPDRGVWPSERAQNRLRAANAAIKCYAEILGLSNEEARARIEVQRLHNVANPLRDLSSEYDL